MGCIKTYCINIWASYSHLCIFTGSLKCSPKVSESLLCEVNEPCGVMIHLFVSFSLRWAPARPQQWVRHVCHHGSGRVWSRPDGAGMWRGQNLIQQNVLMRTFIRPRRKVTFLRWPQKQHYKKQQQHKYFLSLTSGTTCCFFTLWWSRSISQLLHKDAHCARSLLHILILVSEVHFWRKSLLMNTTWGYFTPASAFECRFLQVEIIPT